MLTPAIDWSRGGDDTGDGCTGRSEEANVPVQDQMIQAMRRQCSKEDDEGLKRLMKTLLTGRNET